MNQDHFNALPVGYDLNEYEIKAVLGHGGFGITYLAYDRNLDKDVAIKEYLPAEFAVRQGETTVRPRSSADEDDYQWGLDRFVKEAQTLAVFQHPSIVPVYRFFKANNTAYMVMEYQKGESLSALMRAHQGEFTEQDLLDLVLPLLDGLEEVHRAGYLHRDVKPGNIFIRENGTPVLLDFGAARHAMGSKSKSLTSIVTPGYAPLEQYFADGNQGPWTDIYALAAILYQAITGEAPPEAPARVKKDPIQSAVEAGKARFDEPFLRAIDAALAVEEEDRPQSVAEWREMLLGAIRAEAESATARPEAETGATILAGAGAASGASPAAARGRPSGTLGRAEAPATAGAPSPRKGGGLKIAAIAGAAVFLLAIAAGGTWMVLNQSGEEPFAENGGTGNGRTEVSDRSADSPRRADQDTTQDPDQSDQTQEDADRQTPNEQDKDDGRSDDPRLSAEEEERRRQAEEERRRQAEEERRRQEAEEERRRQAEEERRRQAEEERRRQEAEEERRRQAEQEARERERQEREAREQQEASRPDRPAGCAYSVRSLAGYYDEIDCALYRRTLFSALRSSPRGTTSNWRNPRNGNRGTVTIVESFRNSAGTLCKRFRQTITSGGRTRQAFGTACISGGNWQISG